ncbi:MAG TPA: glycosyltransferase family 4 protein [Pyrinomonadaceae bacterium]|nr:glycosyltransferase family 4 protein [Pyrinomonadaceae bacterium]
MRILFVTLGESIHAARWIKQLQGQGWDIHVFPHSAYDGVHPELEDLTFHNLVQPPDGNISKTVRQTGLSWPLPRGRRRTTAVLQSFDYFKQPARLARVIRELQPDLIHSLEMQRCSYLTLAGRKLLNGGPLPPWIYSSWGSDIFFFGRRPDHQPRIREVLSSCDYFIADCERDVQLAKDFGLRGEVLGVAPANGGFDLTRIRRLGSGLPTPSRKVIAVKGYHDETWGGRALNALEALRLSATQLQGFEVVIFSATSEVKSRAEALANVAGLKITILPASPNDEIIKLMGRARIAIGIGLTDGSPISLLEAMIMGAFPIQADTVSTAEWIRDGENGFLVPPEDPASIAAAIQRALIDNELVERAAKLNQGIADERLDQAVLRPRIIDMYKKARKCAFS